jgi:hypothetical protein
MSGVVRLVLLATQTCTQRTVGTGGYREVLGEVSHLGDSLSKGYTPGGELVGGI